MLDILNNSVDILDNQLQCCAKVNINICVKIIRDSGLEIILTSMHLTNVLSIGHTAS